MNLFLDLEETIIEDWFNRRLIPEKIEIIKSFIKKHNVKKATMFSMAIWGKNDVKEFDTCLKDWIEEVLEISIETLDMKEIFEETMKKHNINIDSATCFTDIFPFNPKRDSFLEFIRTKNESGVFVLFDDTVTDSVILEDNKQIVFKRI